MNVIKLYPRCHPQWNGDYQLDKTVQIRGLFLNASGYLLPCCWCEHSSHYEEFKSLGFFDENLNIDNVNSVKEILLSKQWINFHKTLLTNPDNAPTICKHSCSEQSIIDEKKFNDEQ